MLKDKNGNKVKVGDVVRNAYGRCFRVYKDANGEWGQLICVKGHYSEERKFTLHSQYIELVTDKKLIKVEQF